jgi:hypothetical protein
MTPAAANDPAVVDAFAKTAAQVEVKTPTGPQLDMVTLMPMLNPRLMPVPTMLIHGEYDDVADLDGLLPFFQQLPNPYKRYVVIPNAGHMMHLQGGHRVFQHEVASFFKEPYVPAGTHCQRRRARKRSFFCTHISSRLCPLTRHSCSSINSCRKTTSEKPALT